METVKMVKVQAVFMVQQGIMCTIKQGIVWPTAHPPKKRTQPPLQTNKHTHKHTCMIGHVCVYKQTQTLTNTLTLQPEQSAKVRVRSPPCSCKLFALKPRTCSAATWRQIKIGISVDDLAMIFNPMLSLCFGFFLFKRTHLYPGHSSGWMWGQW